jgi:hypothetical protein
MRYTLIVLLVLLCSVSSAVAQVSVGIGLLSVSIGINIPSFPALAVVPGYPVYYAPRLDANLFFYDGVYWVYQQDNWYASTFTTDHGGWWPQRSCRRSSCGYPCATIDIPRPPGLGGGLMRRRVGASTGAMNGASIEADGTSGTIVPLNDAPRYLFTSGSIQGSGIPSWSNSRSCAARSTAISSRTPWCGRTTSSTGRRVTARGKGPRSSSP